MNRFTSFRPAGHSIFRQAFNYSRTARLAPVLLTRLYSASSGLSQSDIEARILNLLKSYDKVDENKLNANSHFINDLGLDSLDTVEVMMAIEEEFSVEIPDKDADEIKTVEQAINYIAHRQDAH
ncbi:uncharacterized protein VTP21DRAFT_10424 [Calcarisporiella thermophila]|uniref:uncharacterized protein n=1 Tax=Calcarisporiella thermophila TaxID=911321 RepID=UPI003743BC6E